MESIKITTPELPIGKVAKFVLIHGGISCAFYIVFMLLMKLVGLLEVTELRMVNYVILCLVCLYEIRKWVKRRESYVPFLQVFCTAFFTGLWSFFLFSVFLFVYAKFDHQLNTLFAQQPMVLFNNVPSVMIFFEGSAVSIIVALINLQYFRRFEEGETSPRDIK
ncbi:MAG: hypothetical protein H0W61_16180 [Bacteroidetes bacterium]|nr:hypothetical protein [Bacteroidota bacterium]